MAEVLSVRSFAEQLMCHDLASAVDRFVSEHFGEVARTPEFLALGCDDLRDILARDELNVDCEEQVRGAFFKLFRGLIKDFRSVIGGFLVSSFGWSLRLFLT